MIQKDLEVYDLKLDGSLPHNNLQCAFEESHQKTWNCDCKFKNNLYIKNSTSIISHHVKEKKIVNLIFRKLRNNFAINNFRYYFNKKKRFLKIFLMHIHLLLAIIVVKVIFLICALLEETHIRKKQIWVPKNSKYFTTNIQGPKLIQVQKSLPSISCMQKFYYKDGQISLAKKELPKEASQMPNIGSSKFKPKKKKQWVRKEYTSNIKAKVSNYETSYVTIFNIH